MLETVYLVLAETALETVPKSIQHHKSVVNDALRRGVEPGMMLLDRSVHHAAMLGLPDSEKRGRPDIAYHVLLDAANAPLFKVGILELVLHTYANSVIRIKPGLRPPRSYSRYEALMMQLFAEGSVGGGLIKLDKSTFSDTLKRLRPSRVVGFSRLARYKPLPKVISESIKYPRPVFVIGGFPKGHLTEDVTKNIDEMYSVSDFPLDASLVASRLVYEIERLDSIQEMMNRRNRRSEV